MVLNWELLYYFVEHLYLVLEAVLNKCFHNGTFLVVISRFRSPSNSCFEQAVDIRSEYLMLFLCSPSFCLFFLLFLYFFFLSLKWHHFLTGQVLMSFNVVTMHAIFETQAKCKVLTQITCHRILLQKATWTRVTFLQSGPFGEQYLTADRRMLSTSNMFNCLMGVS